MTAARTIHLWIILAFVISLNVLTWVSVRDVRAVWANVPPAPGERGMRISALGDAQFAYREIGVMLQNLGNTGGDTEPLKKYDYVRLKDWLFLSYALDSHSDFVPFLASYYFGAVDDATKVPPLLEYLRMVGNVSEGRKWRWLAQAVFLARYKMNDLDNAYQLATDLAAISDPTLPIWARQMPAFIMTAKGDKETAYDIMTGILKDADKLPPVEVNFMRNYICTRILDPEQAKSHPLCQNIQ